MVRCRTGRSLRRTFASLLLISVFASIFVVHRSFTRHSAAKSPEADIVHPNIDRIVWINNEWQRQDIDGDDEVVVFSSFFDDRPYQGRTCSSVRINAVRPAAYMSRTLYCKVWFRSRKEPTETVVQVTKAGGKGHLVTARKTLYAQFIYTCSLPVGLSLVPSHVSLVGQRNCSKITNVLPVQHRRVDVYGGATPSSSAKRDFAVCVATSFGDIKPDMLVEWIEANRMFGVTLFNIYDSGITNDVTLGVLRTYESLGLVRLTRLPPPVGDDSYDAVKLTSATSFNDCLMANMHTTRFLLVLDFDELIVPRLAQLTDYGSMLRYVDKKLRLSSPYHTYIFRNTFFFTFFERDVQQPSYLRMMQFRQRTRPDKYLFVPKSFVDPMRCLALFNHHCFVRLPGFDRTPYRSGVDVPPDVALSHHYRSQCPPKLTRKRCKAQRRDDVMMRYRSKLQPNVERRLREFGLFPVR